MAQQKPGKKVSLVQIMGLVNQLSPEEQGELRRQLDESWKAHWDKLTANIRERSETMPPLTDEEIIEEVKAVRKERQARRAEGSC